MGGGHLDIYMQLAEEHPVELVAICDIDEDKFGASCGNIDVGNQYD